MEVPRVHADPSLYRCSLTQRSGDAPKAIEPLDGDAIAAMSVDDLARDIKEAHQERITLQRLSVCVAIRIGTMLIEAKKKVPHGDWAYWVDRNCDVKFRVAQQYMLVAREFPLLTPANAKRVSYLPIRDVLAELADEARGRRNPKRIQATSKAPPEAPTIDGVKGTVAAALPEFDDTAVIDTPKIEPLPKPEAHTDEAEPTPPIVEFAALTPHFSAATRHLDKGYRTAVEATTEEELDAARDLLDEARKSIEIMIRETCKHRVLRMADAVQGAEG